MIRETLCGLGPASPGDGLGWPRATQNPRGLHFTRSGIHVFHRLRHNAEYVSPLFPDIGGLSAKGQVQWFPTQLTTVTATALRSVGDSGIIGSAGFLNTTGGIQVDHELLRNLILTVNGTGTQNQYFGISRTDDIWTTGASASWLLTRWFGLTLGYTFADQHSSGVERGPTFDDNRFVLSAVFQR